MVEKLSVKGSQFGGSIFSNNASARPKKVMNCAGLGGNPSSLAPKKKQPNKKPPKTNIFAAAA